MFFAEAILLSVFSLSVAANVFFWLQLRSKKTVKKLDLTAQDLLHDLTRRGAAVLKVEVIDAANLMLRSPRG